ncbi:MAG: UDP-N-acetylmuramoyl-L-alanyl-D-glutamate--2,6-diaminopimelate ligase [Erysipelotrichaceae bacterium]|nr:UDP-N-acetylmuramoyl-L-alanyl-D-glutamate--2,6-diaminopimelate ligase [Erysipelotrichaceae bacterium]
MAKPLNELLKRLSIISEDTRMIERVTCHDEMLNPMDLYVAIPLSNMDISEAIIKASEIGCCVISANCFTDYEYPDIQKAYGILLHAFYDDPCNDLCMIAVTGTNGKTTISTYLYQLLRQLRQSVLLIGTNGIFVDDLLEQTFNTTPSQEILIKWMNYAKEKKIRYVIMEISSIGIDQRRIAGMCFDYVIMSNVTKEHLDYHGSFEQYVASKHKLFQYLKPNGIGILNTSDERIRLWYHQREEKDWVYNEHLLEILEQKLDHSLFIFREYLIWTNQISLVNIYNLCACILVLKHQKYPHNEITRVCKQLNGVVGRLQLIWEQPRIYVDFAHTPDAFTHLLTFFKARVKGRLMIVFGCGGERDKEKRKVMGEIACRYADVVIVTEDNSRGESLQQIVGHIQDGCNGKEIVIFDRYDAIKYAITNAEINDIIIVAGKGNEQVLVRSDETIVQSDEQVILEVVKGRI